jgi:hypothetical protein
MKWPKITSKHKALFSMFVAVYHWVAAIFVTVAVGLDSALFGYVIAIVFTFLWRHWALKAFEEKAPITEPKLAEKTVGEPEIVAERPRANINKKCPPHKWQRFIINGEWKHKCSLCPYIAGTE